MWRGSQWGLGSQEALHTGHTFPTGKGCSIFATAHAHTWCSTPLHLAVATSHPPLYPNPSAMNSPLLFCQGPGRLPNPYAA